MNEGRKECRNEWINQWLAHLAPPPVENVSNSRQLRRDSDENRQDKCQTPTVFSPTAHGDVRRGSRLQIAARAKGLTRLKHKAAKRKQIRWHLLLNSQTQTNFDFKIHSAVPFHCFIIAMPAMCYPYIHPSIHLSIHLSIYLSISVPVFEDVYVKSSSRHSPVHSLFVGSFPTSRPEPAETETLLRPPHEPLYPKTQGFAPESVFTREFSILELLLFSTYCFRARTALAHNVVDMMMTWRQDCPWTFVRINTPGSLTIPKLAQFSTSAVRIHERNGK